jgi:uncharacterized protein with von Willebrand factor type A (vWA) domain
MRPTDVVVDHPLVAGLGGDSEDQARVAAFARDLAAWLVGDLDADGLGWLGRVVVAVLAQELGDARILCAGRATFAVEAAAAAVAALWPLLRSWSPVEGPDGPGDGPPPADWLGAAEAGADAAVRVERDVRELDAVLPGLGATAEPGALRRHPLDPVRRVAAMLDRSPALRELADRLGRRHARRATDVGGGEEITGVVLSGDAARALPSELAWLADPDTEDLFYQRLVEGRLLSWELRGSGADGSVSAERRGPIVACVDTSGSMDGAPEWTAKAVILAVCRVAASGGRPVHLVLFGGPGERTEIRLGPGRWAGLLEFLSTSFGGGTDFDAPLVRACALLDEQGWSDADVLVVTDGLARVAPDVVTGVRAAREAHAARFVSVVIGVDVHGVAAFSDEVHRVEPIP